MNTYRVDDIRNTIKKAGFMPLDVLLVGATGVGKSSTLNALFGSHIAQVGEGVDPETMLTNAYQMHDYLRVWDSPGLGDGKEADSQHAKAITDVLCKTYPADNIQWGFIDLVLVVLDGSVRDMGTTYRLLHDIILKNIQPDRVIIAINQADLAMKGRHWNHTTKTPDHKLYEFLEEKSSSVTHRVYEATNLTIKEPVFYSAREGYNLEKLMDTLIEHIPCERRSLML